MAMTAKQIVHNYMLSAVKKSKKKIQIKCSTIKDGKAVYSAIFEGWPTYAAYIDKVKSGLNYKDFILKFDEEWATEEFYNILMNVKANSSLKVTTTTPTQAAPPTETPKFDDPAAPAPTNPTYTGSSYTGSSYTGSSYTAPSYTAPGGNTLTKVKAAATNNKTLIIAGAAVLLLVLVLVLVKRK